MKQHINNIPLPIKVVISITITIIAIECDPIKYSVFFVDNQKRLLVQSLLIASFRTLETRTINVRWLLWHVNALSSFTDCCCDSVGPFVLTRQPVRKRKIPRNAFKDIWVWVWVCMHTEKKNFKSIWIWHKQQFFFYPMEGITQSILSISLAFCGFSHRCWIIEWILNSCRSK